MNVNAYLFKNILYKWELRREAKRMKKIPKDNNNKIAIEDGDKVYLAESKMNYLHSRNCIAFSLGGSEMLKGFTITLEQIIRQLQLLNLTEH